MVRKLCAFNQISYIADNKHLKRVDNCTKLAVGWWLPPPQGVSEGEGKCLLPGPWAVKAILKSCPFSFSLSLAHTLTHTHARTAARNHDRR